MWNASSLLGLLDKARSHLIAHKSNSKSADGINSQSEIIETAENRILPNF